MICISILLMSKIELLTELPLESEKAKLQLQLLKVRKQYEEQLRLERQKVAKLQQMQAALKPPPKNPLLESVFIQLHDSDDDLDNIIMGPSANTPQKSSSSGQQSSEHLQAKINAMLAEMDALSLNTSKVIQLESQLSTQVAQNQRVTEEAAKHSSELKTLQQAIDRKEKEHQDERTRIEAQLNEFALVLESQRKSGNENSLAYKREIQKLKEQIQKEKEQLGAESKVKENTYLKCIQGLKKDIEKSKQLTSTNESQAVSYLKELDNFKCLLKRRTEQAETTAKQLQQLQSELNTAKKQATLTQAYLKEQLQEYITKATADKQSLAEQLLQHQQQQKKYTNAYNQLLTLVSSYESGHVEEILKKIYERRKSKILEGNRNNDYSDLTQVLLQTINSLHAQFSPPA